MKSKHDSRHFDSQGASTIYTEDSALNSLANRIGRIEVMPVTEFRKQTVFPALLDSGDSE